MTQIQAYETMSKEALLEHHLHILQQHADDMEMLSKELARRRQEALLDVIRQLNRQTYSLTKRECISVIEAMRAVAPTVAIAAGWSPVIKRVLDIAANEQLTACSCPSGNGSLRPWPCPVHLPETASQCGSKQ